MAACVRVVSAGSACRLKDLGFKRQYPSGSLPSIKQRPLSADERNVMRTPTLRLAIDESQDAS